MPPVPDFMNRSDRSLNCAGGWADIEAGRKILRSVLEENAELKFTPGEKFAYSDISCWLLSYLIERVSGLSYEQYVRQHIFRALRIPESEIDFVIASSLTHAFAPSRFLNTADHEFLSKKSS